MGLLDLYRCPNTECWWDKTSGKNGETCPECGTSLKKVGVREGSKISIEKNKLKKDPEIKKRIDENKKRMDEDKKARKAQEREESRLNQLLFHEAITDDELIRSIESDMNNLAGHEAGTKWMRVGTLLSFNSTEQMIGAGFKAIIDQNKVLIKQNELLYRQNKLINAQLEKLNNQFEDIGE
jgi:uncharacterized Zn finger protein (UPF0148 family)